MKKNISLILLIILLVCTGAACSAGDPVAEVSTTSVTDTEGQTRYYEYVTDENGETVTAENGNAVLAEIETDANGTAATRQSGEFVTKEETTVISNQTTQSGAGNTSGSSSADNEIPFDPGPENETTSEKQTQNTTTTKPATAPSGDTTTQSATDADGWINKWY